MVDDQLAVDQKRQRAAHKLWLAMRAAHDRYQSASATLHALSEDAPDDPRAWEAGPQLDRAAEEQRTAFEAYIESRLEFSEFMLSEGDQNAAGPKGFYGRGKRLKPRFLVLAAALLFPTVSVISLIHEQKCVRQVDTIREAISQMAATVAKPQNFPAPQQSEKQLPGPTVVSSAGKSRASTKRKQEYRRGPALRAVPSQAKRPMPERRTYEFSLNLSKRLERVGPVHLLLRGVHSERQSLDLSIVTDGRKLDANGIRLHVPTRIHLRDRPGDIVIVIDRVIRQEIRGSLAISEQPRAKAPQDSPGKGRRTIPVRHHPSPKDQQRILG
jgi:hypothetical protein